MPGLYGKPFVHVMQSPCGIHKEFVFCELALKNKLFGEYPNPPDRVPFLIAMAL